jgi:NADPH:quinone reductase-like Zn-dependent oxidoreductase
MMKLYEITEPKGIDSLKLTERPTPRPGPGEVLVRVRATLNSRDLTMIKGGLVPMMKLPLIPVSDGAGDVVETGPGATTLKKGDRVAAIFTQCWLAGPPRRRSRVQTDLIQNPPPFGVLNFSIAQIVRSHATSWTVASCFISCSLERRLHAT